MLAANKANNAQWQELSIEHCFVNFRYAEEQTQTSHNMFSDIFMDLCQV